MREKTSSNGSKNSFDCSSGCCHQIVLVTWSDAHVTTSTTESACDVAKSGLATAMTVGWLKHLNDEVAVVCTTQIDTGQGDYVVIPKPCIKSIKPLSVTDGQVRRHTCPCPCD